MDNEKTVLLGMSPDELKMVVKELGMPQFTAGQILKWLYQHHVRSIDEMTNISKANRELLAARFVVGAMDPIDCQRSVDGTVKYLFPVRCAVSGEPSQKFVETVYIPERSRADGNDGVGERATLCVSCQVGCKMNCLFCQTGKQGYEGSLTAADILNQIYALPERDTLTNIVFMGQGEPMDNLDAVLRATEVLTAESECHVAISMHSPLPEQRRQLMPAEGQMSITEVVSLLKQYDFTHQRRCSFEYICFAGLNDTTTHAREIIRLLEGLECRVNLIRFHEIPDVDLPGADEKRMEALRDYLTRHGVFTTIRASRGQDIFAACGLLSTAVKGKKVKK